MKKITRILAFILALSVFSCTKEGLMTINEITDHYTAPTDATVMNLSKAESTWSLDRRYFKLDFGNDLVTTLVGYDALLAPGQYVLGADAIGNAIDTKVKGAAAQAGYVLVTQKDGKYQVTGTFGDQVLFWEGTLPFTPDPAATQLSVVMSAQSNLAGGTPSVTMNLATPGISQGYDENWQQVWTGEGGYLALDLYSDDGYLHDGVYTASAQGGVIEPGQFGIGWDPGDLYGIGWIFENWGTCWWEVAGGKATANKITEGLVTVSSREEKVDDKDVTIWTIFWGSEYPQELVFEGAIPALTKPKKPSGPVSFDYTYTIGEPAACSTNTGEVISGVMKYPFTFTDKNDKEVAYLEFVLVEGSTDVEEGDYVSTEYAHEAGQLANGYYLDYSEWGWGIIAGGSYYINGSGEKVYIAPDVVVSVTNVGTGVFKFVSDGFDLTAAGPNYVPGGDDGGDDVSGDVVLKLTSGLTYTMEDVTAGNTDASQNPLSGMTLWRVTVKQSGETVAAFDLGTAEGSTDVAGTYEVMSYPDAVGKAGNGWGFASWGMFGGCYFKLDGAYYFIPTGATVTVTNKSDGSIKIKFEGAIQDENYGEAGQGGLLLDNVAKS